MKIFLPFLFACCCCGLAAQSPVLDWALQIGGSGLVGGRSVTTDAAGNVYALGNFDDSTDFDPGLDTFPVWGFDEMYLVKLDAAGNFQWVKTIGEYYLYEEGYGVTVDGAGNIYVLGYSVWPMDIQVTKLDNDGNLIWMREIGGPNLDEANAIAVDAAGNVYLTGHFGMATDFDPGPDSFILVPDQWDVFLCKLDAGGNFKWAKQWGGDLNDDGHDIAVNGMGEVYVTGYFNDTADFDPGPGVSNHVSNGSIDAFLTKLDSTGEFLWAVHWGNSHNGEGYSAALDGDGNIYTTGYFRGIMDFDPGSGVASLTSISTTHADIYVNKLDEAGNFLWAWQVEGSEFQDFLPLAVDSASNVYFAGSLTRTIDFDPGPDSATVSFSPYYNGFVSKLDPNGNFEWVMPTGRFPGGIAIGPDQGIITVGTFSGAIDFDPSPAPGILTAGGWDAFFHKVSQPVVGMGEKDSGLGVTVFPNPTTGRFGVNLRAVDGPVAVTVMDALGRVVQRGEARGGRLAEFLLDGPAGVYHVLVQAGKMTGAARLVKQ